MPDEPIETPNRECDVCGNQADENGVLIHGKGCFVVSEDGGGVEYADDKQSSPVAGVNS